MFLGLHRMNIVARDRLLMRRLDSYKSFNELTHCFTQLQLGMLACFEALSSDIMCIGLYQDIILLGPTIDHDIVSLHETRHQA
jgi:hypothetical protein